MIDVVVERLADVEGGLEVAEQAANLGDAEVPDGEADPRVGGIEWPPAGDEGEGSGERVGHGGHDAGADGAGEGRSDAGPVRATQSGDGTGRLAIVIDGDLGRFLRHRRESVTPAEVGLPTGTRRRTPGLRRAELATLAGISVDYLVRLEQGRDTHPSAQVLAALADALHLDEDDRDHLRMLAAISNGRELCPSGRPLARQVRPTVTAMLDALEPSAAFVVNRLGDVLAWNSAFERIVGPVGVLDGDEPNLARFTFGDPRALSVFPDWSIVADEQAGNLRAGAACADPALDRFVAELTDVAGVAFADRWACRLPPRSDRGRSVSSIPTSACCIWRPRCCSSRTATSSISSSGCRLTTRRRQRSTSSTGGTRALSAGSLKRPADSPSASGGSRQRAAPSSSRTNAAPATIALSLAKATSRGRYFMPQSGATTIRSAGTWARARRIRSATTSGDSTVVVVEIEDADDDRLAWQ